MVLALAGDSTITSEVEPAGAGGPRSSTSTAAAFRAFVAFVAAFFFAAGRRFFAAPGRAALPRPEMTRVTVSSIPSDFFRAMLSVYGRVIGRGTRWVIPSAFHERTQVIERNAPVDLNQRPLDDVLELGRC